MEPRPLNTKIVYVAHLPEYCPGLDCDVVSNLVVEIAIYNFDLFHSALLINYSAIAKEIDAISKGEISYKIN